MPWRSSIERLDAPSFVYLSASGAWTVVSCSHCFFLWEARPLVWSHHTRITAPRPTFVARSNQYSPLPFLYMLVEALGLQATLTCWVQRKASCINVLSPGLVAEQRRGVARQVQVLFCPHAMPCSHPFGIISSNGNRQSHEVRVQGSVQITTAAQRGVNSPEARATDTRSHEGAGHATESNMILCLLRKTLTRT